MSVTSIFQFIGISFIPVVLAVLIYIGFDRYYKSLDKKDPSKVFKLFRSQKRRCWIRQITSGLLLGAFSIGCYFLGVQVNDYITDNPIMTVGISTFFPVIAGFIFGWPSCAAASIVSLVFRAFMPSSLRWATVVACALGGIFISLASHFLLYDNRGKWYYGFFGGLVIESLNLTLLFLFNLNQISDAYRTIRQFDIICLLCNAFACAITCLVVQLYEREKIITNLIKDNRISGRIQISLFVISLLGFLISTSLTYLVTYHDALDTSRTQLVTCSYDMHEDFRTMQSPFSAIKCVDRHVVSEQGYVLTVCASDTMHIESAYGTEKYDFFKNQIVGVPSTVTRDFGIKMHDLFKFGDGTFIDDRMLVDTYNKKGIKDVEWKTVDKVVNGQLCLIAVSTEFPGQTSPQLFYSVVIMPYDEIELSAGISRRVVSYLYIIVFTALFALVNLLVSKRIIKNIQTMDNALERIMDGNLNEEIVLKGGYKEFEQLSNNINLTVGALKNYGEEIERRIASELDFAKEIQENSLPTVFPNEETYNIYAMMNTAKEIGGDFYDCFKMNNGRIMILIADVSGKGIPAAMFMMRARTLIKSLTLQEASIADIATQTNNLLIEDNEAGIFVTAWLGILDPYSGELNYVNAGHCEPLLKSNGKYEIFHNKHQLVLAGIKDYQYQSETIYLKAGEELLLYTDGVTEATDKDFKQYGVNRLISFTNNAKYFNAKQLLTEISDDVAKFEGYSDQFDDITMLSLCYLGANSNRPENVLTLKAFPRNASVAINYVESILTREGVNIDPKYVPQMSIVVDELFANVAYHAYPKGVVGELTIEVDIKDDILYLTFVDGGTPFDPTLPFKADTTSGINERKQGGLGIFLVKKAVDKLTYERKNNMNHLYIEKNLKPTEEVKKEDK